MEDMDNGKTPYWLSFCGQSGTGKTFLGRDCLNYARALMGYHKSLKDGCMFFAWPDVIFDLREGKYFLEDDFKDCNCAMLDDIGADRDPTGFAADTLYRFLNRRGGKWTIITSNLKLEKLGEIDTRIASRLIRDLNVCVNCNTIDFALRKNHEPKINCP